MKLLRFVGQFNRGPAFINIFFYLEGVFVGIRIAIPIPPEDNYPNYFAALKALGAEGIKAPRDADPAAFSGLLLPGGDDVDPANYRQPINGAVDPDPQLDALQLAVIDRFFRAGKMIFGICRGHQLLNVYFGGTLIQDLKNGKIHDWDQGQRTDKAHLTSALPGSWVEKLYGPRFPTNSAHHQAVDELGKGLIVDQYAEDGVIEAAHHENGRVFSVQWHPERMCFQHRREDTVDGSVILEWFLRQCETGI